MVISFGGLATGMDTNAIVTALMDIERAPLNRMEQEKEYLAARLEAFSQFESKLTAFADTVSEMNSADKLGSYTTRSGSEDYFSLAVSSSTQANQGNYQMEVVNLAQVQKDVSVGYTDNSDGIFSGGSISIGTTNIAIDQNSSLNDIREAINQAEQDFDTGVTASTIFDGTNYRLVLTGEDAETSFTASATGISDGTTALSFSNSQAAEMAEVTIDGISIISRSNRIENAIPGISIDLLKENVAGESTTISVESDFTEMTAKIEAFATAYNDINAFIEEQKDSSWGNDPSFRTVTRKLQSLLVTGNGTTGNFSHLVDIGFKSDSKTGTISIDTAQLQEALTSDYESVETLLIGDDSTTGILGQFDNYIDNWTDTFDGLYAGKKQSYDGSVRSLDRSIERLELRLEQRERTLLAQFMAMEELVANMNATSSYLTQQIANMPSIGDDS